MSSLIFIQRFQVSEVTECVNSMEKPIVGIRILAFKAYV